MPGVLKRNCEICDAITPTNKHRYCSPCARKKVLESKRNWIRRRNIALCEGDKEIIDLKTTTDIAILVEVVDLNQKILTSDMLEQSYQPITSAVTQI